jgi:hypothetical protein
MQRNIADTDDHIASLASIADEVRQMNKRIDDLLALSKSTRATAVAAREALAPREAIMAALEAKDEHGKMRGKLTHAEIRSLLHCGNSSVIHHAKQLVKQGKVVLITRKGEDGISREYIFHADAVAL